jgi:hypothetical protein
MAILGRSVGALAAGLFGACLAATAGCGADVSTTPGGGGSGATSSGAGASGAAGSGAGTAGSSTSTGSGGANSGDCEDDGDCPGGHCVEVTPGGFRTCAQTPPEATQCHSPPAMDQCCSSAECAKGKCFEAPLGCGGPQPIPSNACLEDACASDAACAIDSPPPHVGVCVHAGVFGVPVDTCMTFGCRLDSDCQAEPGGLCEPITDPCCGRPLGLYCVYPQGGCRSNADCASGHCQVAPDGSRATCVPGPTACPA